VNDLLDLGDSQPRRQSVSVPRNQPKNRKSQNRKRSVDLLTFDDQETDPDSDEVDSSDQRYHYVYYRNNQGLKYRVGTCC
jgi:hypothetical protein